MRIKTFKGLLIVLVLLVAVVMLSASGVLVKEKEVKKETITETKEITNPDTVAKEIVQEKLIKGDEKLKEVKILKVGKYEIDTTKHKPNDEIELKKEKAKIKQDGEEVLGTIHESAKYSKNKKYVVVWHLTEGVGEHAKWSYFEIYGGTGEKKLLVKISLEEGRDIETCTILSNGYIVLHTDEFAGSNSLVEIYNLNGEKIFETNLEDKYYYISPNEEYIIISDSYGVHYKIFTYNLKEKELKLILKLEKGNYYAPKTFSADSKYIIIQRFIKGENYTTIYCIYESNYFWKRKYTISELGVDEIDFYCKISKDSKYIIYGTTLLNLKNGKIIKKNLTEEELKQYMGE